MTFLTPDFKIPFPGPILFEMRYIINIILLLLLFLKMGYPLLRKFRNASVPLGTELGCCKLLFS